MPHPNLFPQTLVCLLVFGVGFDSAEARAAIDIAEVEHAGAVDFEKEIQPVLRRSCLPCHNRSAAENDLVLETPATILTGGAEGPAVVPGKSAESLLLKLAAHQQDPIMPPTDNPSAAPNLTPHELGLIRLWIDQGAQGKTSPADAKIDWQPIPPGVQPIYAAAISADGQLAAAGRANQIVVYDVLAKRELARLTDPGLLPFSPQGGSGIAHLDLVQSLAFSPDGEILASGAFREVKLWRRVRNAHAEWRLERAIGSPDSGGALVDRVTALAFSRDGKLLATGGGEASRAGELKIWDAATGPLVREIGHAHSDTILAVEFSHDDRYLASCSADRFLRVFDVSAGALVRSFEGHTHHVMGLTWSADDHTLVTAGADKVLKVWDFPTGDQKRTIEGFAKEVTAVRFVADTPNVIASCGDHMVYLKQTTDGAAIRSFSGATDFVYSVAVSRDGKTIVAGSRDGVLNVWSEAGPLIAAFALGEP